jgi:signal transduction histidine kinase
MFARIRKFLASPVFEDEEKTRIADLLNIILLANAVIAFLFTVILITSDYMILPIIGAACVLLELVLWFMMRRGHVRLASIFFTVIILVSVTIAVYFSGNAQASIAFGYITCIVAAGILIGGWAAFIFTISSLIILLGLSLAEAAGLLPPGRELNSVEFFTGIAAIFSIAAVLVGLASRSITGALARARQVQYEIRKLNEELEQRVIERTIQLEDAVKELETFSYSISHDLGAPLRAIDGFTRILIEDHGSSLDAEGRRVCAVLCDETRQMKELIDGLLTFSRFGRAKMQIALIDMETLVNSVFDELTTPETRGRIDLYVGPLPPAMGDRMLIHQVWQNLVANAIMFSSKRERAIIEIDGHQSDNEIIYYVHDNGVGFDMKYAQKLFDVFERLHSERDFKGTVIGLAIVQRIVKRHGGRVWAEGQADGGATFYFTLSRKRMDEE